MEKKGIFLTHRHISWLLSLCIMSSFFIFVAGYFLGKKKAVEKFYNKIDQDSLADRIYYSVCSIYENNDEKLDQESTEDVQAGQLAVCEEKKSSEVQKEIAQKAVIGDEKTAKETVQQVAQQIAQQTVQQEVVVSPEKAILPEKIKCANYYAELIGFGTARAAQRFCEKLKKQGFAVVLKKRRSRSARGKTITWYQVVTEEFDNKSDLIAFVDIIKDKERLKGIRIVQC